MKLPWKTALSQSGKAADTGKLLAREVAAETGRARQLQDEIVALLAENANLEYRLTQLRAMIMITATSRSDDLTPSPSLADIVSNLAGGGNPGYSRHGEHGEFWRSRISH